MTETETILDRINALSAHLGLYRPTKRDREVGRTQAYYERLNQGRLPVRKYKTAMNRGQVPLVVKQGELWEVEEFGTAIA